jgi:GH43 family beta-xylosidase
MGKINIPQNNLVIAKDTATGIYGTGHNSVIQIPGQDQWYIIYHRFNYPKGISMGESAGYNREVCIDKLEFNNDGSIKQVTPTHQGIKEIKFK